MVASFHVNMQITEYQSIIIIIIIIFLVKREEQNLARICNFHTGISQLASLDLSPPSWEAAVLAILLRQKTEVSLVPSIVTIKWEL